MKKLIFIILCLPAFLCQAQLKVEENGKIMVGEIPTLPEGTDVGNICRMMIFGPYGERRAGAKLSFGDLHGTVSGSLNAFIGERDTTDTDQLWLQGRMGMYFTAGS